MLRRYLTICQQSKCSLDSTMQRAAEIITIDSDSSDEFECAPKKPRLDLSGTIRISAQDALKKLNALKEISAYSESHHEVKVKRKNDTNGNSLTIIIDESSSLEQKKSVNTLTNGNVVVIDGIDDDPVEETTKPKENINNECTVILDDPSEDSDGATETTANTSAESALLSAEKQEEVEKPDVYDRPSTSKASEAHRLLDQFLDTCLTSVRGSKYESKVLAKFMKMRKHFNDCDNLHHEPSFKKLLEEHINTAKLSAPDAVVSFQRIFSYLLDSLNGASIDVPEEQLLKIKKLEKCCKLLVKKLKELEDSELNFDDENDSTYLQIEKYSARLDKVYKKYCQLVGKNPHAGRLLYEKICFVSSKHDEINRAITKSYKHNKFPTYFDIEKCIKKCVTKHNLPLSESDIREESKYCFAKLGNLLQMRRKKELYETHCGYITLNEDPASNDHKLDTTLKENSAKAQKNMKDIIEKYVKLQDNDVNVELSEDSDNSDYRSSSSE